MNLSKFYYRGFIPAIVLAVVATNVPHRAFGADPMSRYGSVVAQVQPRDALDITASNWSIGAETMGRGFTVYDNWKDYLGPLGVKKARIQSGWARTETTRGIYDWAWMDNIVPDMVSRGVVPWVSLSYGNSIYANGGTREFGSPLPTSTEALNAWDNYVDAYVQRYGSYVDEWEIWNEPDWSRNISATQYADFMTRTAERIRTLQPDATIIAGAVTGSQMLTYVPDMLQRLQEQGKLDLVDVVSYHPYAFNPHSSYGNAISLRNLVKAFDPSIEILQGENGAPSQRQRQFALSNYDWTERSQAKWDLRRMLGDLGHDIPSSLFGLVEMQYENREENSKGIIEIDDITQQVVAPKTAYMAVQHLTAIFDDSLSRVKDFTFSGNTVNRLSAFAYENTDGLPVVTVWNDGETPRNSDSYTDVTLVFNDLDFVDPVYVDLISGEVYDVAANQWQQGVELATFLDVPLYDSPILIAERSLVIRVPEPSTLGLAGLLAFIFLARAKTRNT